MTIPRIVSYPMPTAAELSVADVDWEIDPARAAVLIHDMQGYFVGCFPPGRPPVTDLVANIGRVRSAARDAGVPVLYSVQPGRVSRARRGLLHDFWGPGMTGEPADRDVIAALRPGPGDHVVTKTRYSAFFRTEMAALLESLGRDQLVVCGVFAHIGCLFTVADAVSHDVQAFLLGDAVADFSRADHLMALDHAAGCCAVTTTTRRFLDRAATARPAPSATRSRASGRSAGDGS
ncbi:isochorismatase family protein [Actinoplanes sp. NPDC051494]|uniref:isochorismatase family protein n=1 Tax=Actinoplanes sp. NPDC051494 TaxID=3363907 RepID=UPI003787C7B9